MSSRVGGAAFALTAAALLAVSSYPLGNAVGERSISSWWSGFPTIGDHQYRAKEAHIGLLASSGCDIGAEEDHCQRLTLGGAFTIVKYVELGFASLLVLALVGLGITSLAGSEKRKLFARLALAAAAIAAIVSIVLLLMGPDLKTGKSESVPMAMIGGLGLFFLGTSLSIIAGVMTLLSASRPQVPDWVQPLQLAPARQSASHLPPPPQQPPVDVLALLHDDGLRPSALGPEPRMGARSPGGSLPGPSGPLGPMGGGGGGQPLFSGAPQLRPLYEVSSDQGGSDGFVKPTMPQLPVRGPTPMPQAAVKAYTDFNTPGPAIGETPTLPAPPPKAPAGRGKPPTLPPPNRPLVPGARAHTPSNPPPFTPGTGNQPAIPRTFTPGSGNQPAIPRTFTPGTGNQPPITRAQATIASAAVPPPKDTPLPPSLAVGVPISTPGATLAGVSAARPETDDGFETVDFDKQTMEHGRPNAKGFQALSPVAGARIVSGGDTDPSLYATGDSTSPSVPFESATGESVTFSGEPPSETFLGGAPRAPSRGDDDSLDESVDDNLETAARERISAPMPAQPARISNPILTSATPPPPAIPPVPRTPPAGAPARPARPSEQVKVVGRANESVKVPISTAPSSLPPPKEKPSAVAGPSPACPQCESPMAWVEEHLRFYCKSCRMYF